MSIMNQLNNYLKNGALILVAVMLITVPNLNVYSSIGSYKIVSSAIVANKVHQPFPVSDYASILTEIGDVFAITIEGFEATVVRALMGLPSSEFGCYPTRKEARCFKLKGLKSKKKKK